MSRKAEVWLAGVAALAGVVVLLAWAGAIALRLESAGAWLILVVCWIVAAGIFRRFVTSNFDDEGRWAGRVLRRD